jgi:hypothetical protein
MKPRQRSEGCSLSQPAITKATGQVLLTKASASYIGAEESSDNVEASGMSIEEEEEEEGEEEKEEIHYHVSSSILKTVSPKFASMLSDEIWKEGIRNENDDRYYILAKDWDADALLVLLNVLHLRNRQVPRSVSLSMLTKIAVLTDYYNCVEALELSTEIWIKDLKNTAPVPSNYCKNLTMWMCIAWVSRLPQEFTQATEVAIKRSTVKELPTFGLPITGFVGAQVSWHS